MPTNITVLNTIWENASDEYTIRIPQATQANITAVGNAIMSYAPVMNEFLDALVNRISLVIVSSKLATNKLAPFKKGMIEYGSDIEEIFTSMASSATVQCRYSRSRSLQKGTTEVQAIFHRVNREDFYKVTIEEAQIKRAFLSNDGLGKLVASITNSLYSADAYDEYLLMKQLVADYFNTVPTA